MMIFSVYLIHFFAVLLYYCIVSPSMLHGKLSEFPCCGAVRISLAFLRRVQYLQAHIRNVLHVEISERGTTP